MGQRLGSLSPCRMKGMHQGQIWKITVTWSVTLISGTRLQKTSAPFTRLCQVTLPLKVCVIPPKIDRIWYPGTKRNGWHATPYRAHANLCQSLWEQVHDKVSWQSLLFSKPWKPFCVTQCGPTREQQLREMGTGQINNGWLFAKWPWQEFQEFHSKFLFG